MIGYRSWPRRGARQRQLAVAQVIGTGAAGVLVREPFTTTFTVPEIGHPAGPRWRPGTSLSAMHPAGPMPVTLPTGVRLSSALLFGVAGLALLEAVVELIFVNTDLSVYRDAYTGDTGSGFGSVVVATLGILFAAGASTLAVLNNHGRKNARVTTYVLGGIFMFCGGLGTITGGLHGPERSAGDGGLARVLPAAYGIGIGVVDVLTAVAILAAIVLLSLPSSNRFFTASEAAHHAGKLAGLAYAPYPPYQTSHAFTPNPTPQPYAAPPRPAPPPHTGSIPAVDPWAEQRDP